MATVAPPRGQAASESGAQAPWRKSALRENVEAAALAALFAIFVRGFIAQPYKIPSGSMEETLLVGDHLVVNKVAYGGGASSAAGRILPTAPVRRGDIVIFRPPKTAYTDDGTDYIKRIIGLPGEEVTLLLDPARGGVRIEIDGVPLPENYRTRDSGPVTEAPGARWTVNFTGDPPEARHRWQHRRVRLRPDEFWVMGDNRNDSMDSRYWGPVTASRIRGRAWLLYWSHDNAWSSRDGGSEPSTFGERVSFYAHVALTLFSRTRFERMFTLIR